MEMQLLSFKLSDKAQLSFSLEGHPQGHKVYKNYNCTATQVAKEQDIFSSSQMWINVSWPFYLTDPHTLQSWPVT